MCAGRNAIDDVDRKEMDCQAANMPSSGLFADDEFDDFDDDFNEDFEPEEPGEYDPPG